MRVILVLFGCITLAKVFGQDTDLPINHAAYQILEMEDIRSNSGFSTSIKPFSRKSAFLFLGENVSDYLKLEAKPYSNDSTKSKKPIFGKFYQTPSDFFSYKDNSLDLHINPVLQLSFGRANDKIGTTFVNSRGIEIRGSIDERISFYTFLTENQAKYPEYVNNVRDSTLVVPYEGFWKQYSNTGVDFFRAQGYVDFGISKSISAQLGFGKHFVGNGLRSLILSNFSNNYPYLRINTQTKVFDYTNVFGELIADVQGGSFGTAGSGGFSKKYMAFHHLNIEIKPNLHIGLFESVMYGDSTGGLKIEYLNPVIFYRAVEQQNGSEDNAIIGMDFKWNIKNRVSLYGQLVIDEMIFNETFSGDGWWGNKQGFQLGAKYVDAFGFKNLMIQGEVNRVRPYMYAHEDGFTSYSHYNLSLAHPLGANFTEFLFKGSYQISEKWSVEGIAMSAKYGNDIGQVNFGRDILKDYTIRRPDGNGGSLEFGNSHLQGNQTELLILFGRVTYMLKHNFFVDGDLTYRSEKDQNGLIDSSTSVIGVSFRWNMPARRYLF